VSAQIAFGTCSCGASGQLFGAGWCAHCMIQWQDVRISALTQVNQELRSLVHGVNKSSTFGPIDGNPENTALENWFPISADELDRLQAENALLRKGVKCQYAEDVGMPEHRCAVECQYVLQQKESGIPDLCPRGTCGVRIPNCPECSIFIPKNEVVDVLYECAISDKVQAEEKWREAGNTTPIGDANPVLITASVLLRRHGEKEAADQVEAIARTFARLVRAMKVTPMTSTNPFGLSAIGDALAEIDGLYDNERCGKDNG
jgi:hypothetical protein